MTDAPLKKLSLLVGRWTTEATHPALPGVVVRGTADFEWLEGERFLMQRARNDHPDIPDFTAILGFTDADRVDDESGQKRASKDSALSMHYFDARGVFRVFASSIDEHAWKFWRDAPGFSQRFTATFADQGATLVGKSQLCRDDRTWADDLQITYRRQR